LTVKSTLATTNAVQSIGFNPILWTSMGTGGGCANKDAVQF